MLVGLIALAIFFMNPANITANAWYGGDHENPYENPSTHRALTQKAVETVSELFPGFFSSDKLGYGNKSYSDISLYSDWPDKEKVQHDPLVPQDVHF